MKLLFRGWKREVTPHNHTVFPVEHAKNTYTAKTAESGVKWNGPFTALGQVKNLGLSGTFLVQFTFEPDELESWLQHYVKAEPEAAVRLLHKMQAEALINLAKGATDA